MNDPREYEMLICPYCENRLAEDSNACCSEAGHGKWVCAEHYNSNCEICESEIGTSQSKSILDRSKQIRECIHDESRLCMALYIGTISHQQYENRLFEIIRKKNKLIDSVLADIATIYRKD